MVSKMSSSSSSSSAEMSYVLSPSMAQKYKVLEALGKGTYGYVFKGIEKSPPHRYVAIKKFRQQIPQMLNMFGMDQTTNRELGTLMELGEHINIVHLLFYEHYEELVESSSSSGNTTYSSSSSATGEGGGGEGEKEGGGGGRGGGERKKEYSTVYFFVFELCNYDLERVLLTRQNRRKEVATTSGSSSTSSHSFCRRHLPENTVKVLAYQLLQATAFCHSLRIIHRDLKPANLLISQQSFHTPPLHYPAATTTSSHHAAATSSVSTAESSQPFYLLKVGDFGLAASLGSENGHCKTEEVVTVLYRAPEIVLGDNHYSSAVDIWAIGAIIAELIRGQPLFNGHGEFDVLMRSFALLGTPTLEEWPRMRQLKFFDERLPMFRAFDRVGRLRDALIDETNGLPLISAAGVEFLERILVHNPASRLTAAEALHHRWFIDINTLIPEWLKVAYRSSNAKIQPIPPHILSPPLHPDFNPKEFASQLIPFSISDASFKLHPYNNLSNNVNPLTMRSSSIHNPPPISSTTMPTHLRASQHSTANPSSSSSSHPLTYDHHHHCHLDASAAQRRRTTTQDVSSSTAASQRGGGGEVDLVIGVPPTLPAPPPFVNNNVAAVVPSSASSTNDVVMMANHMNQFPSQFYPPTHHQSHPHHHRHHHPQYPPPPQQQQQQQQQREQNYRAALSLHHYD